MNLKFKKLIFFLTLGIMGLGMATFSFTAETSDDSSRTVGSYYMGNTEGAEVTATKAPNNTVSLAPVLSSTPIPTQTPVITEKVIDVDVLDIVLEKDEYPEINQLINAYLAAKLDSTSTYDGLVSSPHLLDSEKLASEAEVIKNYYNLICYTKKGINEIDFIVYVAYDVEILMLTTLVPSIDEFYIKYNSEGKPVIYNDRLSEDTISYIEMIRTGSDVVELQDTVNKRFMEAVESDSDLKEFFEKIVSTE